MLPSSHLSPQQVTRGAAWALGLVLVLSSTGCAVWSGARGTAPLPSTTAPAAPPSLPAAWQAPLPHGGSTQALAGWWAQFDDPLLPELIAASQAASPGMASALARVERARASSAVASAAALPQVSGVGSAAHGREALAQPMGTRLTAGVQAQWELDLFGAVSAGRQAELARLQGAQAGWHDARVMVAAETATTYVTLRACEAQLTQTELDARSRGETARLTDASAKAGFTAPAEAALARAGAAQARSTALAQRAQCDTLVKALVDLTDLPEAQLRQRLMARTGVLPASRPIAPGALPASLLEQRPDLAQAARTVVAAAADTQQAAAREKPQVSLSGNFMGVALNTGDTNLRGTTWALGPISVNFPLFDGGSRAAATAASRASYEEAVSLYRAQVRRAVREVESSLVALRAAAARQADVDAAALDFLASLRATEARSRGGLASQFDLETARRNAVLAQSTVIELQRETITAWISLYRALGGGWSPADSTPVAVAPRTP
jgi:NodT family efflux transporter outer membrane factor (OMF) lipoprotein